MIKRRFYRQENGEKSGASSSSSSDSDSQSEERVDEDEEEEEAEAIGGSEDANDDGDDEEDREQQPRSLSPGSGYESEDSSGNEVEGDSSGANEEVDVSESISGNHKDSQLDTGIKAKENEKVKTGNSSIDLNVPIQADFANYILKHKSVFKCRLCPRIVCLSEDTVKAHLKSKRHARSKKLLGEGRLKLMLNSDGEIEEDHETHSERHKRTLALAEELNASRKRDSGRQRQSRRRKKRSRKVKTEKPTEKPKKKRLKAED